MESSKCWFSKFRSKDKPKSSKKKETTTNGNSKAPIMEEAPSTATKQKVAAAKQYIEKHYKEQMKNLQERKERYDPYAPFYSDDHNLCYRSDLHYFLSVHCSCLYYLDTFRIIVVLGSTNSRARYKRKYSHMLMILIFSGLFNVYFLQCDCQFHWMRNQVYPSTCKILCDNFP